MKKFSDLIAKSACSEKEKLDDILKGRFKIAKSGVFQKFRNPVDTF